MSDTMIGFMLTGYKMNRAKVLLELEMQKEAVEKSLREQLEYIQDQCQHTETKDNGFEDRHKGEWCSNHTCVLCGKRYLDAGSN